MKEYAEKYPLAWADYVEFKVRLRRLTGNLEGASQVFADLSFLHHFGYLVLEYFPKHGIEIDKRTLFADEYQDKFVHEFTTHCMDNSDGITDFNINKAIEKAFEIRQGQLEGKK